MTVHSSAAAWPVPFDDMFSVTMDPGLPEPEDRASVTLDCAKQQSVDANAKIK